MKEDHRKPCMKEQHSPSRALLVCQHFCWHWLLESLDAPAIDIMLAVVPRSVLLLCLCRRCCSDVLVVFAAADLLFRYSDCIHRIHFVFCVVRNWNSDSYRVRSTGKYIFAVCMVMVELYHHHHHHQWGITLPSSYSCFPHPLLSTNNDVDTRH